MHYGFDLLLQVIKDLLNHHRILKAGDHFDGATAFTTRLDIDVEYMLQALHPAHRCPTVGLDLILHFTPDMRLVALAPPCRRHQYPMLAVQCKYSVGQDDAIIKKSVLIGDTFNALSLLH